MKRKSRIKNGFLLLLSILMSGCLTGCMSDKPKDIDRKDSDTAESYVKDEEIKRDKIAGLVEQQADAIYQMWKEESEDYERNRYLLSEKYKVCEAAVGDLNGDGQEDLAVVLEIEMFLPEIQKEPEFVPENTRETFILLRKNEKFEIISTNKGLVMGKESGGVFGDPFDSIVIEDGVLTIFNYGGSSDRWGIDYSFIYYNDNLRLCKIESSSYSTLTASGVIRVYDYISGTYEKYTQSGMDEELSDLLLDYGTFDGEELYIDDAISEPYLCTGIEGIPQIDNYGYQEAFLFEMEYSAIEALKSVRQSYYADTVERKILWTNEIQNNYQKLLHTSIPDSYFCNQEGCLSYNGIRPYEGENGIIGAEHVIMWKPYNESDELEYYYVDAVTGEVTEQTT